MSAAPATPLNQIVLSPGSPMTVSGLSWQHYQLFLAELGDNRATRLAYSDGSLEIRMPSELHEIVNRLLSKIQLFLRWQRGLFLRRLWVSNRRLFPAHGRRRPPSVSKPSRFLL